MFPQHPYTTPNVYYGPENDPARHPSASGSFRARANSTANKNHYENPKHRSQLRRRGSHDQLAKPRRFLINDVDKTLKELLESEDTDHNYQITIDDEGPKVITLPTADSNGHKKVEIRGTYMLSNLLQELTSAKKFGKKRIILDEARLNENPVARLSRLIQHQFWNALTRRIDKDMIDIIATDEKSREQPRPRPRIYVPLSVPEQYEYYTKVAQEHPEIDLDVVYLPDEITPEWIQSIALKPGLLALAMDADSTKIDPETGNPKLVGVPYVVPGGRYNEFYGWDSYMESLGLIANDRVDLAKGMVRNFVFELQNYGKILNANRSYYLGRSQPPFLTDMTLRVYEKIRNETGARGFLKESFAAAIKEYKTVWVSHPRLDEKTGLSRYRPVGKGFPPETEPSHFDHLLLPYAKKYNISIEEFMTAYDEGKIEEPEIDQYLLHDCAVRESGHDNSYRMEGVCADLATVDLNSLLFKYESDIAKVIKEEFDDHFEMPDGSVETSEIWKQRMVNRRAAVTRYLWNEERGMFFDYNTKLEEQTGYESCTTFWTLYSGLATPEQAKRLVETAVPLLEEAGGLVASTEKSRGVITPERPNRQWDYPFGWPPQQLIAWIGFQRYGFHDTAQRLAYKWLYMMTRAFVDFNGVVVEKYNVTSEKRPHLVNAEYGNQGSNFKGVATEGFGWTNSSYVFGLSILSDKYKKALGALTPPAKVFNKDK